MEERNDITGFLVYDKANLACEYLATDDPALLRKAKERGMSFLAEYADGTRRSVRMEEVDLSKVGHTEVINIVQQEVFVPMMNALVELMDESMEPAVALLSLTPAKKTINSKFEAFKEMVEEMNQLYGPNIEGGDDGDAS